MPAPPRPTGHRPDAAITEYDLTLVFTGSFDDMLELTREAREANLSATLRTKPGDQCLATVYAEGNANADRGQPPADLLAAMVALQKKYAG